MIVPSNGASNGNSFLGCWPTSLGRSAFDLVQTINSAAIAPANTRSSSGSGSVTGGSSGSSPRSTGSQSSPTTGTSAGVAPATSSPGAAAMGAKPLTGVLGVVAGLLAML